MNGIDLEQGGAVFSTVEVERWRGGARTRAADQVAEETPVALEYNGISHVVMMASPADLEDFALGFSLTEGILDHAGQLYDCEVESAGEGVRVALTVASECFERLKAQRRNLTGRTGCGLCGAETLQQAVRRPPPARARAAFGVQAVQAGMRRMAEMQSLQQSTGATHAAGWLPAQGEVELVREDIGRHNALDKLIGALARRKADFGAGAMLVTSRASYEMALKTATMGVGLLAAVSAPTALAIRLAEESGLTLAGFARETGLAVYAHPQRLS
ncbi:MAG: formate dehydrogenase accessory sulfurtransferase FdhD [Candidatus Protistobacter heckmanni]|nr:formate dehydrogenase accessory sulfurtransferase FdhD [Candidatus Protistobacter heckmanni]